MYFYGKLFIEKCMFESMYLKIFVCLLVRVYVCLYVCVLVISDSRDLDFRSHPKLIFMQCCQPPDSTSATAPEQTQPEVFD